MAVTRERVAKMLGSLRDSDVYPASNTRLSRHHVPLSAPLLRQGSIADLARARGGELIGHDGECLCVLDCDPRRRDGVCAFKPLSGRDPGLRLCDGGAGDCGGLSGSVVGGQSGLSESVKRGWTDLRSATKASWSGSADSGLDARTDVAESRHAKRHVQVVNFMAYYRNGGVRAQEGRGNRRQGAQYMDW